MTIKCEVYYPEGIITETTHDKTPDLKWLQAAVGGYIEMPPRASGTKVDCFVNEDGLRLKLPANLKATHRAMDLGYILTHPLVGPVVFAEKIK